VAAPLGVEGLAGPLELPGGPLQRRPRRAGVAAGQGDRRLRLGQPRFPRGALPHRPAALGGRQVPARAREITVPGARDGRGHGQHDRAELAEVVPSQHGLGPVHDVPGLAAAAGGTDHRAERAVQEVLGHRRGPGQPKRPLQQSPGLCGVALGHPYLSEPLQRVRLAGAGSEFGVQEAGLGQLGRGEVKVAGQQPASPHSARANVAARRAPLSSAVRRRSRASSRISG
jgi:hypothetical protein